MKIWTKILKIFGYAWLTLGVLLICVGIFGVWMQEGFTGVQSLLSPFNITNWIFTLITLAPGIGALIWADKLQPKL